MNRTALALILIWALSFLTVAGTRFVDLGKANPLPPIDPKITIDNPQNATFSVNAIVLNFTGASNNEMYSYYYSLDGQNLTPIENITIISQEDVNIGKNPAIYRTTVKGSCVLYNLSEGWHNLTVYNIITTDYDLGEQHQKGDTICFESYSFKIEPPFPTATIAALSGTFAAIIGVGLLVYFKKRKR